MPMVGQLGAQLVWAHHQYDRARFMAPGGDVGAGYAAFLGSQLDHADAVVLVAEQEGRIAGYLYAAVEPRNWKELRERAGFVHDIFVDDQYRGAGIADALLNAAFDWMRERGVPRAMLWTASANEHARRMFERRGFRSTMIEMTKELDP
jgi:GNAT superfamily N-acetyltransferase